MPAYRKRKNHLAYAKHTKRVKKVAACEFCDFTTESDQVIDSYKYFWLVKNIFGYDFWDNASVQEHLMLVPKRHVETIGSFTKPESDEYVKLVGGFDDGGYMVYARAPNNITKSVPHQHTHLIKIDTKPKRFVIYLRKPHILLSK